MEANLPSIDLDAQIQSLLHNGGDLSTALSLIRKRDLGLAATATKARMLQMKRCPICTLAPPCRHYSDFASLPEPSDMKPPTDREGSIDDVMVTRRQPVEVVRYRSVNGDTFRKEARYRGCSNNSVSKSLRRRVRLLEKLDKFKEEKLRKQIEKLENEQRAEEARKNEEIQKERQRRQRLKEVKALLSVKPAASKSEPTVKKSPRRSKQQSPPKLRELVAERISRALELAVRKPGEGGRAEE